MSTLPSVELGVLGPLQVRQDGAPVAIPGAKPRAILTMLGLHNGSVVSADSLIELLWGEYPPRTAAKALQTHISSLRRTLGDGVVLTEGAGWTLDGPSVDATRYKSAAKSGREAAAAGDTSQAVARFEEAMTLWRGIPELPDGRRGLSEKTRWIEGHAALVEDRADALLATGRAAEVIGDLEAAVAEAPLRERRWGQLMLALYRAGRQGEALNAYQRARALLADELGVDPGPELRRLEAAIVAQDDSLDTPVAQHLPSVTRAVTFLLTDIEGSTAAWEADADAMAVALARHDELVEQVVTSRGGRLIKTRGEGDATFSVFERPSAAAAAAIELQDAIGHEPWALREPMRIRVAVHTGEVELRDGDYFGRAVNRAARLRSLAAGGQILCSGAVAELVIDSLPDDVLLTDLGMRQLRNLPRPEHVFELRLETAEDVRQPQPSDAPMERPDLPAVLIGPGPFVGRGTELERLLAAWQIALAGGVRTVLIAGEPGVGKTRLAGEWSQRAYAQGACVLYGRCDEDLGAPYQPFAEALRALVPCVGAGRLRGLRGVEALLALVPGLTDVLPDLTAPARADPDTERYALFDAVVALLDIASTGAPIVLILDDLHWAAKPTLLLLRHLLRFGDHARVQIVGTYRSTDLDRSHPLAAMLADLHRDGTANRLSLSGLDEDDVTAYVAEAGYDDEELAHALASVTGGNPFFLIEALRHVDESGGVWDQSTLPQGVREAVSRRLSRLPIETNKALAAAAVVGSRFSVELVESVVGSDLIDAFDEACKAGIVIEEAGGHYRFNHAIVRQSLLAELPSVRRMRLHQRIATTLETRPGSDGELLAELAYHYFECAWAGNAAKAVEYCRRAADQAMTRLGYEGAADLYDRALHALEEIDEELPDRANQVAELLVARCEALLAAGDVASAVGAVSQLQTATVDSARLAAWATCFDGQLSMLIHPERLDEVETALSAAAGRLAGLDDAAGEAKAHTVRAACLARLGRIADCEIALDDALTAARRAREPRWVNAVLAGAPLAALWGPNPVPRAGGRCLDVVRLLRITTDSPAVEATSTRCQAILEAFRGRAAAARRMIDSARRTVTEFGLRHALLEVEQFAGIVELVVDDAAAAEPHLRKAYNGFRRMGLDADTAETAALLGRTCLALDRDAEADELCTESERLAGNALKASIAWRTLRAQLLSRGANHDEARRVAEAAVSRAERTDALVDHGDACLALATILGAAGDAAGKRAAAERAIDLYERKGAAALAERARRILGEPELRPAPAPPEGPAVELDNACVRAGSRLIDAVNREDWDGVAQLLAPYVSVESRRKIVGFPRTDIPSSQWPQDMRQFLETGMVRYRHVAVAVRGERLALTRLVIGTADLSSGAPQDEMLHVAGLDEEGRIALQVWFDVDDLDAAIAELDAAHARFEELHSRLRRLENIASQAYDRVQARFAARDWDAMAALLADDFFSDDRRRVVNAGIRRGRDAAVQDAHANAGLGVEEVTSTVIATRGERLVLRQARYSSRTTPTEPFHVEALSVVETDADERVTAIVNFGLDDFDAAIAELEARYIAGEAAPYSGTWSVITQGYASVNRRELPAMTSDFVSIDHRRGGVAFASGDLIAYARAGWDNGERITTYVGTVHRLNNLGSVVTREGNGTSQDGFAAEWRKIDIFTVEGDLASRFEVFDEADLDAAIAKFDQLGRPAPRLENAASQVNERFLACFAARDWAAMTDILADDFDSDDRRRAVNAGRVQGRDAMASFRTGADFGFTNATADAIATRGARLVLTRARYSRSDEEPEAFRVDLLQVVEIDADERIAAWVTFDPDDFYAAIAELDARYLAGEASAHAQTWSVIAGGHATVNRRELPPMTPDCVSIDHRRGTSFAPGELTEYFRAGFDLDQDVRTYVEVVHRLSDLGTVCTHAGHGVSRDGFAAEWRGVDLLTVEGDMVNRCEVFDETDLDAALAKFDQLSRPARRLENAASQVYERLNAYFAARDWDAMAEILADDLHSDDRRRVVNAGRQRGRDALLENLRWAADFGFTHATSQVIATRGKRLTLARSQILQSDDESEPIYADLLQLVEIDAEARIKAFITLDPGDFDAAIAELDARYLAGDAAAYARTWSVITGGYAAVSRHELPSTTPDLVDIDHRRGAAFAPGDLLGYLRADWELNQDVRPYVEVVHRLNNLGAVVTHATHLTSREGFEAELRATDILTVDGDRISRCEVFDEADTDAALARFEELLPRTRQLENTASRGFERYLERVVAHDWDAAAEMLADDYITDDRRHVTGGGIHGRDAEIASVQVQANLGVTEVAPAVIAVRGERLALSRVRYSGRDQELETFLVEMLIVLEINADDGFTAAVAFDLDDIEAAFTELDARYIAGEAAAHSRVWSVITGCFAALSRHELPPTTPDLVDIDHRRGAAFAPGELIGYLRAGWEVNQRTRTYVEVVHRLNNLGAVVTHASHLTSREGFEAEWRAINVLTVDGVLISRCELFDEADLDAAIARFDQLSRPAPRLENAASQVCEHYLAHYAARDWDAMAEILAVNFSSDDRRRVVGAGVRHGRDAQVANMRAISNLAIANVTSINVATRGERLVLQRVRFSDRDQGTDPFLTERLGVGEIDADERIVAFVSFDLDNFDAALAELDARYLAGEAAAHSHTWSLIAGAFAAINRHELPELTPDWVNIDHRRGAAFATGDMTAYLNDLLDDTPDINVYIEVVHRLSNLGAVITQAAHGTSQLGFQAEWREIGIFTFDGDLLSRFELFDDADLATALAKFEQLSRPAPQLQNAASQVTERFLACFRARDWDAFAKILVDDITTEDRRRVVNAGIRQDRDAELKDFRSAADLGVTNATSDVIATRGQRLVLIRSRLARSDGEPEAFHVDLLWLLGTDAEDRIAAWVTFDPDDIDASIAELDARYLAGEAAAHSHTWSLVAAAYECYNRRELPATTPDWVNVDRRRLTIYAPGDVFKYVRGGWNHIPDISFRIEAVHQLSDLGAVVTQAGHGTSQEGFDAEWRDIHLMTVQGGLFNRSEIFDEADLDVALARFEQLSRPAPLLENAASQVSARFLARFAARDWAAMAELLADDYYTDDRRRAVNAGIRYGRDAAIEDFRAGAGVGFVTGTAVVVATRGARLALTRARYSVHDQPPDAFQAESLHVVEIDADELITAVAVFDLDEFDAAFEELDTRYHALEAAPCARTWSVITRAYAALNKHQLPATTSDWVTIDHRVRATFEGGDLTAYIRAGWDITPDLKIYIEEVHRLSDLGAVVTHAAHGRSLEGLDAEWRAINVLTVDGALISRCELFDEADLDAALAKFDQLNRPAPRLENAASQVEERYLAHFAERDWNAVAEALTDDFYIDDRRRVVNAGIRHGRDAEIEDLRAAADAGFTISMPGVIATRGELLAVTHIRAAGRDSETIQADALQVFEIDADELIAAVVVFDLDDIDAAIEELDARYLAGEAAAHAHTWSVITGTAAAFKRRELPATTPGWVNVDHRRATAFAPGDFLAYLRAAWDQLPDISFRIEAVHRLSNLGAVVTQYLHGTSQEGFDAEWREIHLMTIEGDLYNRSEVFGEADIDAALARFDELHSQTRLGNAASQVAERFLTHFAASDWHAVAEMLADNFSNDDRRRVVGAGVRHGRDAQIADMRAIADLWITTFTATSMAIRGKHLVLMRAGISFRDQGPESFVTEVLGIVEINGDEQIVALVSFDPDDFDAAFAELDARYLAGEAASHAHMWSVIADAFAALNRHEIPATTTDFVIVDHRLQHRTIGASGLTEYLNAAWDLTPDLRMYIETVHQLSDVGAVITLVRQGTSREGFDAEWRIIELLTGQGDVGNRCEVFAEADLAAALARFEELHPQARRLENAASRVTDRVHACFAAGELDAMAAKLAGDFFSDDRRRVVNAGIRRGRDAAAQDVRANANVGVKDVASTVIATRGERLVLSSARYSGRAQLPEPFHIDVLTIFEINADERVAAVVMFDPDDINAAFEELDARYLAGEAAAHSHTWSVVARECAAFNRHELPAADWVTIDHRLLVTADTSDMPALIRAVWDLTPNLSTHVEAVHRLSRFGAVITRTAHGTSHEGFDAEWQMIQVLTVEGDRINSLELFDEADLDAALARFDELSGPAPRLENAASRVYERFMAHYEARDWNAIAETLSDDHYLDDRRRVVNAGIRHGRDAEIANMQTAADVGTRNVTSVVIATRGTRLALSRSRFSGLDQRPDAFHAEVLNIVEIDTDERVAVFVLFEPENIDAAFAELDARYLAGEAAAHSHTWSVIAAAHSAVNRHEVPATTPDWIMRDHRPITTFEASDLPAFLDVTWSLMNIDLYVAAVHRLSDLGAVVTHTSHGTGQEGLEIEWRLLALFTVDGDMISRTELYDEADLDGAIARFEELHPQAPRLENAASRVNDRFFACFAARNWAAIAETLADGSFIHDRRRVVNAGLWDGRDVVIANLQAVDEAGTNITSTVIATRGERLVLTRICSPNGDPRNGEFGVEMLGVAEIDNDERIVAHIAFEPNDIDAAYQELDARYLAGEAAAHSHTWSVIARTNAAFNRHELHEVEWVTIDHRPLVTADTSDMPALFRSAWNLTPDLRIHIEAVHRLSSFGAVVTRTGYGTSPEGFDAEWRMIHVLTVEGDRVDRCEIYDEANLDAALIRFAELHPQAGRGKTRQAN